MKCKLIFVLGLFLASLQFSIPSLRADVLDNWTTNQITTNSFGLHHVVYGNSLYVAVGEAGDSGGFYTSRDGLHWMFQYSEPNSWGVSLNYSSGHFTSVAPRDGFNAADVSADGTNWTTSIFVEVAPSFTPAAITYGNGMYVVVGSTNNVASIMTSADGITWTSRSILTAPGGQISGIAYGPLRFVAIGNNDGFDYTSSGASAGVIWTRRNIVGGNTISYANGLFFVPLNNKTNLLSVDGINWSLKATGLTNMLGAVTYGNSIYMAQSGISSFGSYLATSTDGTNWFQYAKLLPYSPILTADFDVSLATDGNRLVAVGAKFVIYGYSYNSFVYTSDVLGGVRMTNTPSHNVALSGLLGRNYQIQSADVLAAGANNWKTNLTVQLPNTPYVWTDPAAGNTQRFYRAVLLP